MLLRRLSLVSLSLLACGELPADAGVLRQRLPSAALVISQVYGAGDTTSPAPPLRTDFVELRNRSAQPVSLAGVSLQYAAAMGSNWLVADFDPGATVPPLGYHLVAFTAGMGTRGANLPPPDTTNALVNVGRAEFKVALVTGPAAISGACPLSGPDVSRVIDLVGAGATNCSEGPPAPAASVTTSLQRRGDGCLDTDRNGDDFEALPPVPRNGQSPATPCFADGGSPSRPDAGPPFADAGAADAGPAQADAGPPTPDAGASAPDAGAAMDAGPRDAGASAPDAGPPTTGSPPTSDGGAPDGGAPPAVSARSGCRCAGVDPLTTLLALAALSLGRGRRRDAFQR
ncbi:MAG: lamin tail domain-containing protein [Myxococcaceae bacterium]|jgi:hypothetical protein|nr:lamin tail domain-containing protein [Myxococcaceae bacterium]